MTNGEKLQETFPNMRITVCESYIQVMGEKYEFNNTYPLDWWYAEYKEPTVDCRSLEDIKKLVESKADDLDGVMLDASGVIIGLYFAIANDLSPVTPISKECIDCIAEDKTFIKMDRIKQLLNSCELDDLEVLKKIREVVEE